MVTNAKVSPKMVNPRDMAGECRRRRKNMQTAPSNDMEVHVLWQEADLLVQGCAVSAIVLVTWLIGSEHWVHTFSKQECRNH